MKNNYENNVKPQYRLLTKQDILYFHLNALEILENIGIKVDHPEGETMLLKNGCKKLENGAISFPAEIVEKCLKTVPSEIRMYNQLGEEAMILGGRNINFGTGTDLVKTFDLKTKKYRQTVLQDVADAAIVTDYCKEVDFAASFGLPCDIHKNLTYLENVKTLLYNTSKPIFFTAAGKEDLKFIIHMAEAVAGGKKELQEKPFLIHYSEPTAPLLHSFGAVQKVFTCADNKVPICYVPADLLGASCPCTLAGGITQALAEDLSGIVLHQLRNPGAPIISGFAVVPLDMRTSIFCYGSPELRLANSAFSDIFYYYDIPKWSIVGTDGFTLDPQAGFEHGIGTLMAALDGANLIHDIGYLGQGLLGNIASILMSNEIISYSRRVMRGFKLNSQKIALDVIKKVGPSGSFLKERHTLHNFREEIWRPIHSNRDDYESWIKKGKKSYTDRITEKALNILQTHKPIPLSDSVKKNIEKLVADAYIQLKDIKFKS